MANNLSSMLNLLSDQSTVESLSQKTNTSNDAVSSLLSAALPMLMSNLSNNASTTNGALSLAQALTQHSTNASAAQVVANADTNDGAKILQHILGNNTQKEINALAKKTGLTAKQVTSVLTNLTPALLSTLSSAFSASAQQAAASSVTSGGGINLADGLDLGDVMGLLSVVTGNNNNNKPSNSGLSAGTVVNLLTSLLK